MMNKQLLKYNNLLLTRVVQINTIDDKVECLEAILHEGGGGGLSHAPIRRQDMRSRGTRRRPDEVLTRDPASQTSSARRHVVLRVFGTSFAHRSRRGRLEAARAPRSPSAV